MRIVNRLAAYDRQTEHLVREIELSEAEFEAVRIAARVPASYETTFGSFPLDLDAVQAIASPSDLEGDVDWFLEASAPYRRADNELRGTVRSGIDN